MTTAQAPERTGELLPCPMCQEPLLKLVDSPDYWHAFTDCFLEGARVAPAEFERWNTRSPSPAGEASEEAETLAVRAACQVLAESTEDLLCLYPDCDCEKVPNAVRAALAAAKGE